MAQAGLNTGIDITHPPGSVAVGAKHHYLVTLGEKRFSGRAVKGQPLKVYKLRQYPI